MIINMIAAMAPNRVIGTKNKLPWHYSQDLKRFKSITTGKTVIMGKNTFFSIGFPLPNRKNVVLSDVWIDGVETVSSFDDCLNLLKKLGENEVFVIGGAMVYTQFLPHADYLYITQIKKDYDGDVFFPDFEPNFDEIEREVFDEFDFVKYIRKI